MRVLLVEDDRDLADGIVRGLRREHLAVDHAASGAEAETYALATAYDVVCLDLGLPDCDGLELCRRLRGEATDRSVTVERPRRIIILTARDSVTDRVTGLDSGADDYLVKPFKIAELAARLRALARRVDQSASTITVGDVTVDPVRHIVTRRGRTVDLTGREFAVLRYLASRPGEVVSSEDLLEHCWDANADAFSGSVRVILSRVRRKLGDPPIINTIKGVGYRIGTST